jgi:hypothetical protein
MNASHAPMIIGTFSLQFPHPKELGTNRTFCRYKVCRISASEDSKFITGQGRILDEAEIKKKWQG